ncbi:tryptophan synthase beta subunit-like PLP-dependent enzyme [Dichomitus squalens]|uniref:L-serine ammonia-lyase n=1 Tax=Dichomitus squalens TaxID=114155 RepID=A0A4Q9N083_9APHY|nr:tryptophan synthase beta subunit-like PLP-dependent enzyme [Dichomitus squalens]
MAYPDKLWQETPLIRSIHISSLLGCDAYLKLENLQPSQSFKYRGVSHFAQNVLRIHGPDAHLVIASSGNAGIAAACAANILHLMCTVFLPYGVSQATIDFMRKEGAKIDIGGEYYHHALQRAQAAVAAEAKAVMVPGYDHPLVWEGHASMVHEMRHQLPDGVKPDAIFCSVGGGGLAGGIIEGCKAVGWDDVPLVTAETHGSNCFYQSLALNESPFSGSVSSRILPEGISAKYSEEHNVTLAHLSKLTSRATSLGAIYPSGAVVRKALDRSGDVRSFCVPDEMTMQTALSFAEDHKMLVELACAAALSPAYNPPLFRKLVPGTGKRTTVVFVVCGGSKISLADMEEYKGIIASEVAASKEWTVAGGCPRGLQCTQSRNLGNVLQVKLEIHLFRESDTAMWCGEFGEFTGSAVGTEVSMSREVVCRERAPLTSGRT